MIPGAENTMRVLKGQDPIQKFRCRMNWHRWTAWSVSEADWNRGMMHDLAKCYCADCGFPRVEIPYSKSRDKPKGAH